MAEQVKGFLTRDKRFFETQEEANYIESLDDLSAVILTQVGEAENVLDFLNENATEIIRYFQSKRAWERKQGGVSATEVSDYNPQEFDIEERTQIRHDEPEPEEIPKFLKEEEDDYIPFEGSAPLGAPTATLDLAHKPGTAKLLASLLQQPVSIGQSVPNVGSSTQSKDVPHDEPSDGTGSRGDDAPSIRGD